MKIKNLFTKTLISFFLIFSLCENANATLFSSILYQYGFANKNDVVPAEAPKPFKSIDLKVSSRKKRKRLKINVWEYQNNSNPQSPVIVYFHGNAVNIKTLHRANILDSMLKLNANILVFDYPRYGRSKGKINQKTILKSGQQVINYAIKKYPHSPLVLWGRSVGTGPAVQLAKVNQRSISQLILTSPFDMGSRLIKKRLKFLPNFYARFLVRKNSWKSFEAARTITTPTLIHHGKKDTIIHFDMGLNLSRYFPSNVVTFVELKEMAHNNIFRSQRLWSDIKKTLDLL